MKISYEYSFAFTTVYFVIVTMITLFYTTKPRNIVIPYVISILLFTGSSYGTISTVATLYSRGTGELLLSLMNIFLFFLFIFVYTQYGARYKRLDEPVALNKSFLFVVIIIIVYDVYGILSGVSFENMLASDGMINFINMYVFYLIIKWSVFDEKQLEKLIDVFIYVAIFMSVYGLIRWAWFGGDPANFYLNYGDKPVKITYFDIGQSIIFGVTSVILYHKSRLVLVRSSVRWFYYLIIGMCLANILLSFRRTAWVGIGLIFLWIFLTSSASRKLLITGIALVALASGASILHERFNGSTGAHGEKHTGLTSDFLNKSGKIDLKHGRFAEIANAMEVANQYALTGLGPWAVNSPRVTPQRKSDFVHSSILFVYIKTGIFGMLAYITIFIAYIKWWFKVRKRSWRSNYYKALGDSFFCGLLFELPDIMFGTPLIIFRQTQIIAILLIMPYLCYRIDNLGTEAEGIQKPSNNNLLKKNDRILAKKATVRYALTQY